VKSTEVKRRHRRGLIIGGFSLEIVIPGVISAFSCQFGALNSAVCLAADSSAALCLARNNRPGPARGEKFFKKI